MANITETIKFAGPDRDGNYKVLSTQNTYLVDPGEVYSRRAYRSLIDKSHRRPAHRKLTVSAIEPKFPGLEAERFGIDAGPNSFSEESGGKVLDALKD